MSFVQFSNNTEISLSPFRPAPNYSFSYRPTYIPFLLLIIFFTLFSMKSTFLFRSGPEVMPQHRIRQEEKKQSSPAKRLIEDLLDAYAHLGHLPNIDGNALLEAPDANHSCNSFLPMMAEVFEIKLFATICSASSPQWTPTQLYDPITYAINAAATRLFMSRLLFENEEWLQVSSNFVMNSVSLAEETRKFPRAVRPIAHRHLRRKSSHVLEQMKQVRGLLLLAINDHKIKTFLAHGTKTCVEKPAPLNSISAMMEEPHEVKELDEKLQAKRMALSMVSIHMASLTVCRALHALAERPMLIIGLREEIREAMAGSSGIDVWTESMLGQLEQVDYFLREVRGAARGESGSLQKASSPQFYDMHLIMDSEGDGLSAFANLEIKMLVVMFILRFDVKAAGVEGGYRTAQSLDDPAKRVLMLRQSAGDNKLKTDDKY